MSDPAEVGWRIHSALTDWTAKVDTKASFALTIESALLAGVVALSGSGRSLSDLSGCAVFWYVLGILILILSVLMAVSVVAPRLRSQHLKSEASQNFIYFGHLRFLNATQVANHLNNSDIVPVLSRQLVVMSQIAWQKHRRVQLSLLLSPIGVAFLGISAWLNTP